MIFSIYISFVTLVVFIYLSYFILQNFKTELTTKSDNYSLKTFLAVNLFVLTFTVVYRLLTIKLMMMM